MNKGLGIVVLGAPLIALMACGATPSIVEQAVEAPVDPFAEMTARYEAFVGPVILNAWREAVGEPVVDAEHYTQLEKAFFADESVDKTLSELVKSPDPDIRERAQGWIMLRGHDGMHESEAIQPMTDELMQVMLGPEDHPLHGVKGMMTLYSSQDPQARDEAQQEAARRSAAMFPLLATRSRALNTVAQAKGYQDYVHARTGLTVKEATHRLEAICSAGIAETQAGWQGLLDRGTRVLKRAPTEADWFALSTGWSAEAGRFMASDTFEALSTRALARMGFDMEAMNIEVRITPDRPGGAAYGVSIPDDVRFRGHFPSGFEGARGWFHELGHAVHMKMVRETELPWRDLPYERSLSEGAAEVFGAIIRDPSWLTSEFPELSDAERKAYFGAVAALDALAMRINCYLTRLELSLFEGALDLDVLGTIHREVFGVEATYGPAYALHIYLPRPLYVWEYVISSLVTKTFMKKLGDRPLVSEAAGEFLRESLLAPGARVTVKAYLGE